MIEGGGGNEGIPGKYLVNMNTQKLFRRPEILVTRQLSWTEPTGTASGEEWFLGEDDDDQDRNKDQVGISGLQIEMSNAEQVGVAIEVAESSLFSLRVLCSEALQ